MLQAFDALGKLPAHLTLVQLESVSGEHLAIDHQCGGAKSGHRPAECSMMLVPCVQQWCLAPF